MISRSLPPLPPEISNHPPPNEVGSVDIDSTAVAVGASAYPKGSRPKRKKKNHNNSRNSHLRHGDMEESTQIPTDSKTLEDLQRSSTQNNSNSLPLSDDIQKPKTQKIGNLSILDRLKLKKENLRDEERFEIHGEHSVESTFSTNPKENLSVTVSSNLNANLVSQPIAKMFVEDERGFRVVSDAPGAASQFQDTVSDSQPAREVNSTTELAVKTEKFFHTFSTFCHGLLAGMALWQCIIVYQLGPPHFETADFFSHYSFLSQPVQTLFYFFFVICIVSAFDRYDIGNPRCSNSKCTFACRSGVIIVIIYPISLLLSLSIANIDDKMSLHNYNASMWSAENALNMDHDLFYWKILNLGRCIGAVVGWIIVALQPNVNSFLHRLEYVGCTVK